MTNPTSPIGLLLGSSIAPERIPQLAAHGEQLGYGELWLAEDYFATGGIAAMAAALEATTSTPVGLGLASAMVRHPAVLAMEAATLARVHPGRVRLGVGLGVPDWLRQMGLNPRSPLTALREAVPLMRRLFAGGTVTHEGEYFSCQAVELTHVPVEPPAIYMGATGPKMLALSGEVAEGTLVSVLAGTAYIRWLRERVAGGQAARETSGEGHRVVAFALYAVDGDRSAAKAALRQLVSFYLAVDPKSALTDVYGITDELLDMVSRDEGDGSATVAREMPERWLDDLVVAGDADECAAKLRSLLDAGADSVCLFPVGDDLDAVLRLTATAVLPHVV